MQGIKDIIGFCASLKEKNIFFNLNMFSDNSITVTLTLIGLRIEVEFQESRVTYSTFSGDEGVNSDVNRLMAWIAAEA